MSGLDSFRPSAVVPVLRRDGMAITRINNRPVNAITSAVVKGLEEALASIEKDASLQALVVSCAGRTPNVDHRPNGVES